MHLFVAFHIAMDARYARFLLTGLRAVSTGCRVEPGGAWTWHFVLGRAGDCAASQEHDSSADASTTSPFLKLCKAIGAPAVRLSAGVPEELIRGDLGAPLLNRQFAN